MARKGNPEDLAATITLLRALRGWNKTQLADASGIDKSQISRYELGRETPSPRTMARLAAGVGLPTFLLEPAVSFVRRLREAVAGQGLAEAGAAGSAGLSHEDKWAVLEALDRAAEQARAEAQAGCRTALGPRRDTGRELTPAARGSTVRLPTRRSSG